MPIDDATLQRSALFKLFWETPGDPDLSSEGLNELSPAGAQKLRDFALEHEVDGTPSAPGAKKIDTMEREIVRTLLDHPRYGAFIELDGRTTLSNLFEVRGSDGTTDTTRGRGQHIEIPAHVSKSSAAALSRINIGSLGEKLASEYQQRKGYFEDNKITPEQRSLRIVALLRDYAEALWSHGERDGTEAAGNALLDAFEQTRSGKLLGDQTVGHTPWSVAQALVLGLIDPNAFAVEFPDARSDVPTTYLNMSDAMAGPMKIVDDYRTALGMEKGAEAYEHQPVLNWLINQPQGHNKPGSLDESRPFSSTAVNWGLVIFPGDSEVRDLPVKEGFEFPLDVLDAFGRFVSVDLSAGDSVVVVNRDGKAVDVEKVIHRDDSGKAVAWSAKFKDHTTGAELGPQDVVGLVKDAGGRTKGDGKGVSSASMGWWGFCDRNTAQKLYKAMYGIPELDVDVLKVKVGGKLIDVPRADAQKLIDMDVSDLVTEQTFRGFRFNEEPQRITLTNGDTLVGRVDYSSLQHASRAGRLGGDTVAFSGFSEDIKVTLLSGEQRTIPGAQISKVVGETQNELSLSSLLVFVSQSKGMYATDSSTAVIVSNGMRWTNKIDVDVRGDDTRPDWVGNDKLTGVQGPLERTAGDRIAWVRGMYNTGGSSDGYAAFAGWIQMSKSGRVINEGFTRGEPDFAWGASGPLDWTAGSSFNPYMVPEMRLAMMVNGVKALAQDGPDTDALAAKLNLPSNWRSLRVTQ